MKLSEAEAIFNQALEQDAGEPRAKFLQSACGQDDALRTKVERLLQAHEEAAGFLPTRNTDASPLAEGPGTQIGKFKILEQIGEGGFGVVYMAEQKDPVRRRVALKIIKLGMDTKQVVARFEAERQALALMDHPNIAKVLDGGCTEPTVDSDPHPSPPVTHYGRPYFVMELVKGRPITKFCDEERLSTPQRLELFIAVCRAIQHAHQKGLVHRDIKPSNILVSFVDGKPVPKIIDFGIAKAMQHDLTDKTVFTRFHQFMGTPAYMSPEQAGTDSADIDTRSDIFSLGVVLYELLTGRTPMESRELASADYDEIRRQIREVEPMRPSNRISTLSASERTTVAQSRSVDPGKLSRLVRGDLDWIVLKAMDKDRNRRYETANEFAKDLQRYLDNEPVTARKPSVAYVFQKFARRHKVALATAACFALLLTVSAGVSAAQAIKNKSLFTAAEEARLKEMSAKQREAELRRIAETERDRGQSLLYAANMNLAKRDWDAAYLSRPVELLELHRPQPGQPDLRNFEWFYLDRLCHSDLLTLKGYTRGFCKVVFSPDGKRLASSSEDTTVKVLDATSGQELLSLKGGAGPAWGVAFSPDGKRLASGNWDQKIKIWDATSGQEAFMLSGHTDMVWGVVFSPDGNRLASASSDKTVKVWNATSGQELFTLKGHTGAVSSVAYSPDGKRLASASSDKMVKVWDAMSGQELLTLKGHADSVKCVAFSPDGSRLASAAGEVYTGKPGEVKVWDATSGQEILTLKGHAEVVWNVAFSPDGKRLASSSSDRTVKVWDAANGQELFTLKGHDREIGGVAFSPDGKRLASASADSTVKVWDAMIDPEKLTLKGHDREVAGVAFSPDGKRLASSSWDQAVKVWDITSGQELFTLKGHTGAVTAVAFSPDGRRLATGGRSQTVKLWDALSGRVTLTLAETGGVTFVAFSPDGKQLASASWDQTVKVWDVTSGQELFTLKGHTHYVRGVAYSPDGKRLASASDDKTVRVWDALSGREVLTLSGPTDGVNCVAFSPDGRKVASGGDEIWVWDLATGQKTITMKGHKHYIWSVVFSPDGNRLASGSSDGAVKLWDALSGQEVLSLRADPCMVNCVAFSPDGKQLASVGWDQTVKVWDAQPRP
jgi:WD40 repeat protein